MTQEPVAQPPASVDAEFADDNAAAAERTRVGSAQRERVGKATLAITSFSVLGRLLGYVEKQQAARLAGLSVSGVYFAASNVPWAIFSFVEQLLTHSFLPVFVEIREKRGEESAWKLLTTVAALLAVLLALVVGLSLVFTPWLVNRYTRGFTPAEVSLTITLARIMLPAVVLMGVASLTYVVLNAYKEFALPASADAALKVGVVVVALGLWRVLGIEAFALGLAAGAVLKLGIHLLGLRRKLKMVRWAPDFSDPALRKLLLLMAPLAAGNVLSLIRPFLDTYFCGGSGENAALKFAYTLTNLPFILIPYALGIALFPFLAEMAAREDHRQIGRALVSAFRMIAFLLLPVTALYLALALPMVQVVFQHGKFSLSDAHRVVAPLIWYALGMLPVGMETVILQIYFAMKDTKTPTVIAYGTFVLYLAVAVFTTRHWLWGAAGVALALTLSKLAKDGILLTILAPRLKGLDLHGLGLFLGKLTVATAALVVVTLGTVRLISHPASTADTAPVARTLSGRISRPGTTAAGNGPAAASSATPVSKPKKKAGAAKKIKAALVFVAGATPGFLVFLLVAYWLRIAELFTLYGVVERRLRPAFYRLAGFVMAPW